MFGRFSDGVLSPSRKRPVQFAANDRFRPKEGPAKSETVVMHMTSIRCQARVLIGPMVRIATGEVPATSARRDSHGDRHEDASLNASAKLVDVPSATERENCSDAHRTDSPSCPNHLAASVAACQSPAVTWAMCASPAGSFAGNLAGTLTCRGST